MELKKSELFFKLDKTEIDKILASKFANFVKYSKEDSIFNQGETAENIYLLISGEVRIEKLDMTGKRSIVNFFSKEGMLFGEVFIYLGKKYDFFAVAHSETELLVLSKSFFDGGLDPKLEIKILKNLLEIISKRAFSLAQKIQILSSFTLRQKIAAYLIQKAEDGVEVSLNLNREELADFLGTTRPSLIREMKRMEIDKLIKLEKKRVILLEKEELRELT